jgi:cell wall-associated NlpC family hydrolase
MNKTTLAAIKKHALKSYPIESCGFVLKVNNREKYRPTFNSAIHPSRDFLISGEEYAEAEELGNILAIVHSHPDHDSKASETDKVQCELSKLPWLIVSVIKEVDGTLEIAGINRIEPEGYMAPLIGREFHHGVLDCYTLIKDYYSRELQIELPDFERKDDWWKDGVSKLYDDNLAKTGFVRVTEGIEVGDLITMQIKSDNDTPNHGGVYVGNGQFIHHLYGHLSTKEVWGGYWGEVCRGIWRYKGN